MEADSEGFSIREYTRRRRNVEIQKCWPFSGDVTGDFIQSILPPITVTKFRWWSHELASLLAKSPVTADDSEPPFKRMAKAKSKSCKKRSVVKIPEEGDDSYVLTTSQRKRAKDFVVPKTVRLKKFKDSGDREIAIKVNNYKQQARKIVDDAKCSPGIREISGEKAGLGSKDQDSELWIHGISKDKRKVCSVTSPDKSRVCASHCEGHVQVSNEGDMISQHFCSVELCCLSMSRLSLSPSQDQPFVAYKETKANSNNLTSDDMQLESREQNKFQPLASKRWLSHHAQEKPGCSCFPGTHLSLQEREMGRVAQPIQSFTSTFSESCSSSSQPVSADMHCGTLLHHSPFDPHLDECMQSSVLYRQRQVEEPILGFPLNLQGKLVDANGEDCRSFNWSSLSTASAETDLLRWNSVDFSSGNKHSIEPALAKDGVGKFPVQNKKRPYYFPARLGVDDTFSEKAFFISDINDEECGQTLHSPVSVGNLTKQDALNQNLSSRNMVANCDGLCLHNTQANMRLMGKDVSVGTSYSDMVRTGERIIAPDASIDCSFTRRQTHQSSVWQRTTLGISENHSTTTLHKNWNRALLQDTSKDIPSRFCEPYISLAAQARTAVVHDSVFPTTFLHPCGSLVSCPLTDLSFHGSGLWQQPNSFTNSQQQLPFPSNYNNVDIGLFPNARRPSFRLPFSSTDPTRQSQSPWPQSPFESSRSGMSFIDPTEQLLSLYGLSYIDVGKANKRVAASVDEHPMKNHKVPRLTMQGGLNSKEFSAGYQIRKPQI